ncbi:MAG: hypothetical protein HZR80_00315 [Candidatus Heimdallarchaeota archaeon]
MSNELTLKNLKVKYKVMPIRHLQELQEDIDELDQKGKISKNKILRGYIGNFKFQLPDEFQEAKYVIALALESKVALVNFHYNGVIHEVMIPQNYLSSEVTEEDITKSILDDVIKEPGYRVERVRTVHLKLLATRSGLGKYGRNNICYVDELGSLVNLFCFYTDYDFNEDNFQEAKMLDECEKCSICINKCPAQAISQDDFIIDVEKCITLYNEIEGEFPSWIEADAHNALIGCMKCQKYCPANKTAIKNTRRFEDLTEEETMVILEGKGEEEIVNSIEQKLDMYHPSYVKYCLPILKRNLRVLLK